jgi:3-methyladenine DNA glycosylase AlkD
MELSKKIRKLSNKEIALHSLRFFKTGKGEYGEGDMFLGIRVPVLRELSKEYLDLDEDGLLLLVKSKWHEERLLALFILVLKYQRFFKSKNFKEASRIYTIYIKNYKFINNWDLVDTTCHKIMGPELFDKDRDLLFKWAKSNHLWKKRISIMTTYYFIKRGDFSDTLKLAKILLYDEHDLIHKVVGWMLREVGKVDRKVQDSFMKKYYKDMPRTMLRYAIEKYPETIRKKILKGKWS